MYWSQWKIWVLPGKPRLWSSGSQPGEFFLAPTKAHLAKLEDIFGVQNSEEGYYGHSGGKEAANHTKT